MADATGDNDDNTTRRLFHDNNKADDPKPSLLAPPIAVRHIDGSDWLVSLVQAMMYLPPLVPVLRDAVFDESSCPGWRAFVLLAQRLQKTCVGAQAVDILVVSLVKAFEALAEASEALDKASEALDKASEVPDAGDLVRSPDAGDLVRSPETAFCLLVPHGPEFGIAFGIDAERPLLEGGLLDGGLSSIEVPVVAGTSIGLAEALAMACL